MTTPTRRKKGDEADEKTSPRDDEVDSPRSDSYLRSLFWLLIAASFFEGYDSSILALVLPDIQETFGVTESALGVSRGFVELGLFFAFFLARLGDRIGRRALLLWSVFGYTVFTTLTVVSWDLVSFTIFQSLARVFFGAEYAVAVTMIIEEFPVNRRSTALGRLLMMSAAGALAVGVFLVFGIDQGPLEWRILYLIGVVPLIVLGWYRRRIKETVRFQRFQKEQKQGKHVKRRSFWEPWAPEFRGNLTLVGSLHLLRALPVFGANAWFFFYAQREAGIDRTLMFAIFIGAFGIGIGGFAVCGSLMERIGRRPTAMIYAGGAVIFPIMLFQSRTPILIAVGLVAAVFFGLGQQPIYGAMATELFPTKIRNQAMAWSRNVFEIGGFILGPLLVGVLGDHYSGALGSIGDTVTALIIIGFVPAVWLLIRYLPETRGRDLDDDELGTEAEAAGAAMELDVDGDGDARVRRPFAERHRLTLLGVTVGLAIVGLVVGGLQAANEVVRRPEGATERFLRAVSDEEEGTIDEYGNAQTAAALTDFRRDDEGDDFFVTSEVGRAIEQAGGSARVPFRVVRQDADETEVFGVLRVREQEGAESPAPWNVEALDGELVPVPEGAPEPSIADQVPSGGGPEPATAAMQTWFVVIALAVGLALVLEGLLKAAGGVQRQGRRAEALHAGSAE